MTAPAVPYTEKVCPKCSGPVWDQKASKFWGTGFFKSGKAKPRWECKNKECGGAIWDKAAPAPAPAQSPSYNSRASKPEAELPEYLRDQEAQDSAELSAKVGVDLTGIEKQLSVYQSIAEWAVKTLPPIFNGGKDAVGMTPESLAACTNTIFINASGKK